MPPPELLCDYCDRIPLDPEVLDHLIAKEKEFSLGPWSRVRKSRCALCRLIKLSFYEEYRTANGWRARDAKEVVLIWAGASGPGGRGAFYLTVGGDHWICFVAKPDAASLVVDSFYLKKMVPPELDISRVKRWLDVCEDTHSGRCSKDYKISFANAFPGLQVIRFIDVFQECLVEVRELTRYVALSYVWGGVDNFRLTKPTKKELLVPGSIKKYSERLPTTLQDAIVLVRGLGLRYLWIDSLCLLQNDRQDLDQGVQVMDLVYEQSWFTIIAACGHDANAGLPGIHPETRKASKLTLEVKPGVSLGVYSGLDQLIKTTVYNSRAWTFQEHVLSRRALYFVDNKVFFRCASAEFSELCIDHVRSIKTSSTAASLLPDAVHMDEPLNDFATLLFYFSKKALTSQSDVLRAMSGIMRRISDKVQTRFLEGLPVVALDAFIQFKRQSGHTHRRPGFPSYSWAGWRGAIVHELPFGPDLNDWLTKETWIVWYKRSLSGITNPVWDPAAIESRPRYGKTYVAPTSNGYFKSADLIHVRTTRTDPTETLEFTVQVPSYPLLQFWTMSGFYKLTDINAFDGFCKLVGKDGAACGEMYLDGFEESTFFNSEEALQIIVISGTHDKCVFLLEWKGGIAERRGIGTLFANALRMSFHPGPKWTEVVLG